MARSLNHVQLIGNLGADPELRSLPSGTQICKLKIATSERYKDKNGEWQETTDWHSVVLWDRLAEIANQYLRKGRKVYIDGRIKYNSYDDKDGNKRYFTEINANNLILLDSKEPGENSYSQTGSSSGQDTYKSPNPEEHLAPDTGSNFISDDDVPF
jgi:single-strand DNA-binding protein